MATAASFAVNRCYVEECADTDLCGLNMDLLPINTTVEIDGATRVM